MVKGRGAERLIGATPAKLTSPINGSSTGVLLHEDRGRSPGDTTMLALVPSGTVLAQRRPGWESGDDRHGHTNQDTLLAAITDTGIGSPARVGI